MRADGSVVMVPTRVTGDLHQNSSALREMLLAAHQTVTSDPTSVACGYLTLICEKGCPGRHARALAINAWQDRA